METKDEALYALVRAELEAALEPAELRRRGSDAVHELAIDAAAFVAQRLPGEIRVRVSSPGGHRAGRTVVEVLVADQPFIVDSVRLTLRRLNRRELLLLHPLLALERDADGTIARFGREAVARTRESYVYAELRPLGHEAERGALEQELERALSDARCVVADHAAMLAHLHEHVANLEACASVLPGGPDRARDLCDVLRWLEAKNFLFMGYRRYEARRGRRGWEVELESGSGLGLLRGAADSRFSEAFADAPPLVGARLEDERVIFFDKTRSDSTVHRSGRLDSVSLKLLDRDARTVGFGRFVGLLTHRAIRMRPSDIPILAARRTRIVGGLGAEVGSHTYKTALEAYDCLPVELLFPAEQSDVARLVSRIVAAAERRKLEVTTVADAPNRSFFVCVALPRQHYEERIREEIDRWLEREHGARHIDHRSSFLDEDLALVHFFCGCDQELELAKLAKLEAQIAAIVERWEDRFENALIAELPSDRALRLADAYADAFPASYRVVTSAAEAVIDVKHLERLHAGETAVELGLDFATEHGDDETHRLKIYLRERPYLTSLLSVVHQFGVRVIDATSTEVRALARPSLWIVSFRIEPMSPGEAAGELEGRALDGLRAALGGRVDSDDLNRLILAADLDWRSVDVLRAYLEFARQIGQAARGSAARDALVRHPRAARAVMQLFRARFDPALARTREGEIAEAERALVAAREPIQSAAEDRVFALLENLVQSTLRTSHYAPLAPGAAHEIAFKLDSRTVKGLPAPAPWVEIFVHSCELVGVHLRGGPVARGGLRWSDRPQDVRSEVLALWRTQMVKNGLIVPVGAKGGFALRRPPEDPKAARAEADRLYARFVSALLRVTDDVKAGIVSAPPQVVRHDGDDPYLVVAADKGTAHLSDVANRTSAEHGFWLGDAFASGGSNGYDHKREAITARGAWLCARRHFAELGRDPDRDCFTVVGIGDMSGDVFGNGLLLMPGAKLVAAFDHRHVFVDPEPAPERAFEERKRLFALPRSSWADYARDALSAGGGIYERGAKKIALSPEARAALGTSDESLSGEELIRAILRAPVDLLWNGGIGTYVKSADETHAEVGDRANDAVRVDARELRAKIVAEGGNVGFTQLARVELSLAGGRIDTDAIHNAGGVSLSDHEVNFKILLAPLAGSELLPAAERSAVLRACAEAADLAVLERCESQSRCLSLDWLRARADAERLVQTAEYLVTHAELEPALERLPSREQARGRGWTRPELAVLLGYTKRLCKKELASAGLPAHPLLARLFQAYFPGSLRERFPHELETHQLRDAITATCLVNHVVDRAGVTLIPELSRALGVSVQDVLLGWLSCDALLGAESARQALAAGGGPEEARLRARVALDDAVTHAAGLSLGLEGPAGGEAADSRRRAAALEELRGRLGASAPEALGAVARALPVLWIAERSAAPVARALEVWNELGARTRIHWLLERLEKTELGDGWSRVAAAALGIEMSRALAELCERELQTGRRAGRARPLADATLRSIEEIAAAIDSSGRSLAPLLVLSQRIRRLC
ncbi:MAG TPA: NAD-glutamate dehydrogenase domain-containing protein [Myxococcota bacterium]|nr:NAD-glutamate dehydrogenase domain-containing protein [Myxococcota bacterium]